MQHQLQNNNDISINKEYDGILCLKDNTYMYVHIQGQINTIFSARKINKIVPSILKYSIIILIII